LFTNVLFDNIFVKAYRGNSIASGPEMGSGIVLFPALKRSGNSNGAFAFQEAND
jgi:hypothetical protein